jgi:hypothetical protein
MKELPVPSLHGLRELKLRNWGLRFCGDWV